MRAPRSRRARLIVPVKAGAGTIAGKSTRPETHDDDDDDEDDDEDDGATPLARFSACPISICARIALMVAA